MYKAKKVIKGEAMLSLLASPLRTDLVIGGASGQEKNSIDSI